MEIDKSLIEKAVEEFNNLHKSECKVLDIKGDEIIILFKGHICWTCGTYDYFVEMFAIKNRCKFNNCLHINEPQCAVVSAVKEGKIAASRYHNYLQLLEEETSPYRN